MDIDKALATQLANMEKRTGKTVAELIVLLQNSGLAKHGEQVAMLKQSLGMGHGDANMIAHMAKAAGTPAPSVNADPLDDIYVGAKRALRPIHDVLVARIDAFGGYEAVPKKAYISLRRKKQFAMIGPATKSALEIGLNAKDERVAAIFTRQPPGGMCQFKTRISSVDAVDDALLAVIRLAYDEAG